MKLIYRTRDRYGCMVEIEATDQPPGLTLVIYGDVATSQIDYDTTQVRALHEALGKWLEGQES